jgi:hypothetical protein
MCVAFFPLPFATFLLKAIISNALFGIVLGGNFFKNTKLKLNPKSNSLPFWPVLPYFVCVLGHLCVYLNWRGGKRFLCGHNSKLKALEKWTSKRIDSVSGIFKFDSLNYSGGFPFLNSLRVIERNMEMSWEEVLEWNFPE